MSGAITGAIAAVVSRKNKEYFNLCEAYKKDVIEEVLSKYQTIIQDELKLTENDIVLACNVEKNEEAFSYATVALKKEAVNKIIGTAKRRIIEMLN